MVSCVQFMCFMHFVSHFTVEKFSKRTLTHWGKCEEAGASSARGLQHRPEIQPGWTVVGWCPGWGDGQAAECSGGNPRRPWVQGVCGLLEKLWPSMGSSGPRVHFQCPGAAVQNQAGAPAGHRTAGGRRRPSGNQGPAVLLPGSQTRRCLPSRPLH